MELQRFLNRFEGSTLVVDGKMGPKTVAEVMKWQSGHNLAVDGYVGPITKAQMTLWAATH
jgi:peptidoglycan hydrolase-like protein with peptidoglycan-binding domain